jgi:hypothetical protein
VLRDILALVPIFSRRTLQQMLKTTDALLPTDQRVRRRDLLNAATEQTLDTEWEVALLYGLSQLGEVRQEASFGGATFPDLHFSGGNLEFVADIAAVNDSSYEKASPLREFEKQFYRRVIRAGLATNLFSYHINSERLGPKTRLLLPRTGDWEELFDENFNNMLKFAQRGWPEPIGLRRQENDFDVTFWYRPGQRYGGGGYSGDYRVSESETNNPIYNTLKRKKDQLKSSGFGGMMGIMLCDGGCRQLEWPDRIIKKFLSDTRSISFVAVFTVDGHVSWKADGIRVAAKCYLSPAAADNEASHALRALLETRLPRVLPEAASDVVNAINHLRWKTRRVGLSHHGGWQVWGDRFVRISSRALHELLAGKLSSDEFLKVHRFTDDGSGRVAVNPFAWMLDDGRMIESVTVEASDDEDDDWLVFEFTERDPAISRLQSQED